VAALLAALALALLAQTAGYQVIVNKENPIQEVDRGFLSNAFLKRVTRWPSGLYIRPVDRRTEDSVREAFTEDVFGRPPSAIRNTWLQAIFDGSGVPPPELDSDEAVVKYVLAHPGAVGYVSASASLDGVKVVKVR
jgi:ABC-type phosphate transport system substrate-binding protein